jgi:hypothetical protein
MGIFKWKCVVCLMLLGVCSGGAVRALADDRGKEKPLAKPAAEVKIDAPGSRPNQTTSANADSTGVAAAPSEEDANSLEAVEAGRESGAGERIVPGAEQSPSASEASATNQEPKRRAQPAPLDGIFPGTDYLGPNPLIGAPDTDPVYPLTKALWSVAPALKNARIKVYGWRCAEEARTDAYPYFRHFGSQLCGSGMPFPEKYR